jgi:deazaflavin-dependent oxidoreductase (nitroreductase family)
VTSRYAETGPVRRFVRWSAGTRPVSLFYARTLHHIDRVVYRVTRGRTTFAAWLSGLDVVMLTTTGARSGRQIDSPVLGFPDGADVVVIASNYGQARHPGWYHNLRAHPRARLAVDGAVREVEAEELEGLERERFMDLATEIYPGYAIYVKRAAPRRISVFRLRAPYPPVVSDTVPGA